MRLLNWIRSRLAEVLISSSILYWLIAAIADRFLLYLCLSSVLFVLALANMATYTPILCKAVVYRKSSSPVLIATGIILIAVGEAIGRLSGMIRYHSSVADWQLAGLASGYTLFLLILGNIFLIVAPFDESELTSKKGKVYTAASIVIGLGMAYVIDYVSIWVVTR